MPVARRMRGLPPEVVPVTDDVVVTRNPDANRWEARVDGELRASRPTG